MEKGFDFEDDIQIDLDNLHKEWEMHAQTRYKYSSELAYLDKVVKQQKKLIEVKKTKLKEAISRLIIQIKGLDPKMTVQQVDATVAGHEQIKPEEQEYSEAQDKLIDLEYNLNMARNAVQAFDDKKTALENEVKLWTKDYFSSPTEERKINVYKGHKNDQTSTNIRGKINRKKGVSTTS